MKLFADGLFSEHLLFQCPHNEAAIKDLRASLQTFTTAGKGEIYSGYRRQILAGEGVEESVALAQKLREDFSTLVVMGIGGSALGAKTGLAALGWAVPQDKRRRVVVLENIDPIDFEETWQTLDLSKTAFAIVTKSGGTIETMAQAVLVLERLKEKKLDIKKHVVAVTDPKGGSLRQWVKNTGIRALELPSDVGGRFSVLTPVGLLPLAFAGIDVRALVKGAQDRFQLQDKSDDVLKVGLRLAELERAGFIGHVMKPYSMLLRDFGDWFVQLWGESLGKKRASLMPVGPLPMAAVGATDQHSLLQLMVEGPNQIITGFIKVREWPKEHNGRTSIVSGFPSEFASLDFAKGRSLGEILNAEQTATEKVLQELGRPTYRLEIPRPYPEALGELFAFYMDLTSVTAACQGVNPYDQPGVELGKKILPKLLMT